MRQARHWCNEKDIHSCSGVGFGRGQLGADASFGATKDETQSESLGDLRALPDRKGKNVAAQFKRYARKYRNDDFPICYVTLRKEKILAWRNEVEAKTPWQSYDFKSLQHWRPTVGSYLTVEAWPDK